MRRDLPDEVRRGINLDLANNELLISVVSFYNAFRYLSALPGRSAKRLIQDTQQGYDTIHRLGLVAVECFV